MGNSTTTKKGRKLSKRSQAAVQANVTRVQNAKKNAKTWKAWLAKLSEAGRKAAETRKLNEQSYVAPICNVMVGRKAAIAEGANSKLLVAFDVNAPVASGALYEAHVKAEDVRNNFGDVTQTPIQDVKVLRWGNFLKRYAS